MADIPLSKIAKTQTMKDSDSVVVIVDNTEYLITKENFQKVISTLTTEQKNKISTIFLSGNGSKILTDSGVYESIDKMFKQGQMLYNSNTNLFEVNGYHSHTNQSEVLDKLSVNNGVLFFDSDVISGYTLPAATDTILGGVKVDGTTITVSEDGVISGSSNYELPIASTTVLGGVKVDGDTIKINNGVISADVINNWSSGISYPIGYFAVHDDKLYQCNTANSDSEWVESKWNLIGNSNITTATITTWTSNTSYGVGDLVIYGTTIYQCSESHTSVESFNSDKWVGLTGATGAKGDKGDPGTNGVSPTLTAEETNAGITIAITDVNGTQSINLSNGTDGVNGTNGVDGKSAYQIAVDGGFEGTEQEWVESLKGESGNNGITPVIDPNTKHWKIGEVDTGVLAEGSITVNTDCVIVCATLFADNWSENFPYTQTVTVANITSNNMPIVDLKLSTNTTLWHEEETAYYNLIKVETAENSIIAYCKKKPITDFTIKMQIFGSVI